jgi:hypothetical protein
MLILTRNFIAIHLKNLLKGNFDGGKNSGKVVTVQMEGSPYEIHTYVKTKPFHQ